MLGVLSAWLLIFSATRKRIAEKIELTMTNQADG